MGNSIQITEFGFSTGHMNVSVRYGDFLFTYILWFEDSSGNHRNVKDTNAFVTEFPESPGIIGSYFYRYAYHCSVKHCSL